jgi:hypothetical protein
MERSVTIVGVDDVEVSTVDEVAGRGRWGHDHRDTPPLPTVVPTTIAPNPLFIINDSTPSTASTGSEVVPLFNFQTQRH